MDISNITDLQQLKAMAYDAIAQKEQAENNLNVINQRIGQLTAAANNFVANAAPKGPEAPAAPADEPSENASEPTADAGGEQ